jgi:hypothetical protein
MNDIPIMLCRDSRFPITFCICRAVPSITFVWSAPLRRVSRSLAPPTIVRHCSFMNYNLLAKTRHIHRLLRCSVGNGTMFHALPTIARHCGHELDNTCGLERKCPSALDSTGGVPANADMAQLAGTQGDSVKIEKISQAVRSISSRIWSAPASVVDGYYGLFWSSVAVDGAGRTKKGTGRRAGAY